MIRLTTMARLAAAVTAAVALLAGVGMADPPSQPPANVLDLRLIGMNDLHGNLEPPPGSSGRVFLEQQWQPRPDGSVTVRILQPSASFSYTWSQSAAIGSKISAIAINGVPIDPAASYRITVNNFLADGGDGFVELRNGTNRTGGEVDLDAFADYFAAHPNTAPPAINRITSIA